LTLLGGGVYRVVFPNDTRGREGFA
jgi:hypothetical protein